MKWIAPVLVALLLGAGALAARPASAALIGDVNGDCQVNLLDLSLVASRYGYSIGSLLYSPRYDLNHDGIINIFDVQIVAGHIGQHC